MTTARRGDAPSPEPAHRVLTAAPEELVTLLLDQLLAALARCRRALDAGDPGTAAGAAPLLGAAREAMAALRGALDLGAGGQVARDLDRVYDSCIGQLATAEGAPDPASASAAVARADALLEPLRSGWQAAAAPADAPAC